MASTDAPRRAAPAVVTGVSRVPFFDNLKYVLIVLVVIGHYIDPFAALFPVYAPLFFWIYLFHMPLFVFTTGLGAQSLLRTDGGFRIARVGQFLLLYLALYTGIYILELLAGKEFAFTPWSVANASWYLLAAALWYLLTPALARVPTAALLPALVLLALVVGYFPAIGDFLSLSRVICFAPFFFLGLKLRREQVTAFRQRASGWRAATAGGLLAALVLVYAFPLLLRVRGILTARNTYEVLNSYAAWGAGFRFVWYAGAVVLGACVLLLVPGGRSWITTAGTRTLHVARALLERYSADEAVRQGIDDWGPGAFMSPYLSDHQLGVAVDASLGRVVDSVTRRGRDGSYPETTAEEYPMPSPVHELSRAAASLAYPVNDPEGWREVPSAPDMTPDALRLRDYLVGAGLVPTATAWWEFTDPETRRSVPATNTGRFRLTLPPA